MLHILSRVSHCPLVALLVYVLRIGNRSDALDVRFANRDFISFARKRTVIGLGSYHYSWSMSDDALIFVAFARASYESMIRLVGVE